MNLFKIFLTYCSVISMSSLAVAGWFSDPLDPEQCAQADILSTVYGKNKAAEVCSCIIDTRENVDQDTVNKLTDETGQAAVWDYIATIDEKKSQVRYGMRY